MRSQISTPSIPRWVSSYRYRMLFNLNPNLLLRARQAIAHVTTRRFAHPRLTHPSRAVSTTSPRLTTPQQLETFSHSLCAFKMGPILVVPLRTSTPGEQDHREPERVPGDQNGLPVPKIARHPTSLEFNFQ